MSTPTNNESQLSGARPGHDATTLLTHETDASSTNCLAQAARSARNGVDEIVFLSASDSADGAAGHVILRDRRTAAVREPDTVADGAAAVSAEAYAAANGRRVLAIVSAGLVRGFLSLPPLKRSAALTGSAQPLSEIASLAFGAAVSSASSSDKIPQIQDGNDKTVHAWLDALGNSVSDNDKKALAQPADDAQTVLAWFNAHKRGDPNISKNIPDNVNAAWDRLIGNDATHKWVVNDKDAVTRDNLSNFIKSLDSSAKSAESSFKTFQKDNKTPDPIALQRAVDASILQGNLTILDGAGKDSQIDQKFNQDDLKAVANDAGDAGLPNALKQAAGYYANADQFSLLENAGLKPGEQGDGTVKDSNFNPFLSKEIPPIPQIQDGNDKTVHAWLDALGNSVSDNDKKALAQPADDAQTVLAWFNAHKRGDPNISKNIPDNVNTAWDRLIGNDATRKWVVNDKDEVTRDNLSNFIKNLDSSAKSAESSFKAFQKDNKTPDPIALQKAVDASILQGNATILDGAGKNSKIDQKFNQDDLKAVANDAGDAGLPNALKQAAGYYANAGQFSLLENAGLNPSEVGNGTVKNSNFDAFLSKETDKTEADSIASLKSSAIQQAVKDAGGDATKVGADYFNGGSTSASGADKAAAMLELGKTLGRYKAGEAKYVQPSLTDAKEWQGDGPSPGQQKNDFVTDVQNKINTLSKDQDLQTFLSDKMPGALQSMVGGDAGLKAVVQKQFDASSSSQALQDAFGKKDANGNPLSTTDALGAFIDKPNFYALALNVKPDFSQAVAGAPQDIKDKITTGYDDINSGAEIKRLTDSGTPVDKAVIKAAVDKVAYDSVLDPQTVSDGTDKFNNTVAKLGRDQVLDGKTPDDLLKGLGLSGPNDPGLQTLVEQNIDKLAPANTDRPKAADIVSAIRSINDVMRSGLKFDDAMAKVQGNWSSIASPGASSAYKAGVFHGASAVLLAGAIGARFATGAQGTAAQTVGQSLQAAGLLTEGGAKYFGTTLDSLKSSIKADQAVVDKLATLMELPGNGESAAAYEAAKVQLANDKSSLSTMTNIGKDVENVGKTVGGVAGNAIGLITGALSAKQAADSGDKAGAAVQGLFAGLNGVSAIAGAAEVAAYVVPRLATSVAASSLSSLGGIAGAVGGVVGGIAAVGGLLYSIIKDILDSNKLIKEENAWYDQVKSDFAPFGVNVPDIGTLLSPDNGYITIDLPVEA